VILDAENILYYRDFRCKHLSTLRDFRCNITWL